MEHGDALPAQVTLEKIQTRAGRDHLDLLGAFHEDNTTLILLGPHEPDFWAAFQTCREWQDGQDDPVDRWSQRVIGQIADEFTAEPLFPFGGPPFHPFYSWALQTGFAWASPVSLLVHAQAGLMVSYRGALRLPALLDLPTPPSRPCDTCDKPCLTACPVDALSAQGYDVPNCQRYIASSAGTDCMEKGCAVRRACPISQSYGRMKEQSAYHMSQFSK